MTLGVGESIAQKIALAGRQQKRGCTDTLLMCLASVHAQLAEKWDFVKPTSPHCLGENFSVGPVTLSCLRSFLRGALKKQRVKIVRR